MAENKPGIIERVVSRVGHLYRAKIHGASQYTSLSYNKASGGSAEAKLIEAEPIAEMRARSDGQNISISYLIPSDRQTSFPLSLSSAAQDPKIAKLLVTHFNHPRTNHLLRVSRDIEGRLVMEAATAGLIFEQRRNKELVSSPIEPDNKYEITPEMQSNGRIIIRGDNDARLSIHIHDNPPHRQTNRETYLSQHSPQVRRINSEAWLNSSHVPSAYVTRDYSPEMDGTALEFLKKEDHTPQTEGWRWAPFCPDRDKYWGIAAKDPNHSCDVIDGMDICIVLSQTEGIQHQHLPIDMPRTYLTNTKVVYLKPEINHRGKRISTEGETGLIHLGDDPHDGWYYVTQPIPKLQDNMVIGYFSLIGRKATLTPQKEDTLLQSFFQQVQT